LEHGFMDFICQLKEKGLVHHLGISYHDTPELLDKILTDHPFFEVVQLQVNYVDWESANIQARACCDIARRHGKEIFVMEPVKGGSLVNLPPAAQEILRELHPAWSFASWALRFAAYQEDVKIVLSGMNTLEQIEENARALAEGPLGEAELAAVQKAAEIIRQNTAIPCTDCRYCERGCPNEIRIPYFFKLFNDAKRFPDDQWTLGSLYRGFVKNANAPGTCIDCKTCEVECPQHLEITALLKQVQALFEPS